MSPTITLPDGRVFRVLNADERYLRDRSGLPVLWIGKFPVVEVSAFVQFARDIAAAMSGRRGAR